MRRISPKAPNGPAGLQIIKGICQSVWWRNAAAASTDKTVEHITVLLIEMWGGFALQR